jgi:hypothetical protein
LSLAALQPALAQAQAQVGIDPLNASTIYRRRQHAARTPAHSISSDSPSIYTAVSVQLKPSQAGVQL